MVKKVNEKIFNAVKAMTASGTSIEDIAEVAQIAPATVSRIRKALDLEDYLDTLARQSTKNYERAKAQRADNAPKEEPQEIVKEVRHSVTVQASHYMEEQQRKTNELLTAISAKLAFIVEELCGTPQK